MDIRNDDDHARIGDEMAPQAAVGLVDGEGLQGIVIAERFTPPSRDERFEMVRGLSAYDLHDIVSSTGRHIPRRRLAPRTRLRRQAAEALQWSPDYSVEKRLTSNLITQIGDQLYGDRGAAIGSIGYMTGMKLGTSSTAPAKIGAGAALVTYKTGSNKLLDGGYPVSSCAGLAASPRQIQWKVSWGAGVINGVALAEAVLVNDAAIDATSVAANTASRALFGPMTLGASDTLAVTWNHLLYGT